jgi:DNA-binding response OmpR family regulator
MMKGKVLIIEDDKFIRTITRDCFLEERFNVIETSTGKDGFDTFDETIDLVILDIMLPDLDGWSVCKRIRAVSDVPIIILTARSEDEDKLMGFELMADDYVTKPFSPAVLVARAKVLIKRARGNILGEKDYIEKSGIVVNKSSREVKINDESLELPPKEFDILIYLMENEGRVLSRDMILKTIWGYDYFGDMRVVDTHIKKLRKVLKDKSSFIKTVFGVGYKFEVK